MYQSYNQNKPQQDRTSKLEDTLNQFIQLSIANKKNTDASIKNLEMQVGKITKQLAGKQGGKFTANTQPNPKEQCKSITIRSGGD